MSKKKYYLFMEMRNPFEDEIPEKCIGCPRCVLGSLDGPILGLAVVNEEKLDASVYYTVETHETLKDLLVIDLESNSAKLMFGADLDETRIKNLQIKVRCLLRKFEGTDTVLDNIIDARETLENKMDIDFLVVMFRMIPYREAVSHLN